VDFPWQPVPIALALEGGGSAPAQAMARLRTRQGEFLLVVADGGGPQALRLEAGELSAVRPEDRQVVQEALVDILARATPQPVRVAERRGAPATEWFVRDRVQTGAGLEALLVSPTDDPADNDVVAVAAAGDDLFVPIDDALLLAEVERVLAEGPAYEVLPPPGATIEAPLVGEALRHEGRELRVEAHVRADDRLAVVARDVRSPERVVALEVGAQGLTGLSEGPLFDAAAREVEARGVIRVPQGGGAYVPLGTAKLGAVGYVVARRLGGAGGAVFFRRDGAMVKVQDAATEARAVDALAATLAGPALDALRAAFPAGPT
jgi:hypothetical protein